MSDAPGESQRRRLAAISDALVRLHAREFGKGPNRARSFILDDFVLCLLHEPYTTAEQTLIAAGHGHAVRESRLLFYGALEDAFRDVIEELTGRSTAAFLPNISGDPPVISALFLLAPADE